MAFIEPRQPLPKLQGRYHHFRNSGTTTPRVSWPAFIRCTSRSGPACATFCAPRPVGLLRPPAESASRPRRALSPPPAGGALPARSSVSHKALAILPQKRSIAPPKRACRPDRGGSRASPHIGVCRRSTAVGRRATPPRLAAREWKGGESRIPDRCGQRALPREERIELKLAIVAAARPRRHDRDEEYGPPRLLS